MSYPLNFTPSDGVSMVPSALWARRDLSFKARALFAFLLSCPSGHLPPVGQVEQVLGIGRDVRRAAYRELRAAGLLQTRMGTWSVVLPKGGAA